MGDEKKIDVRGLTWGEKKRLKKEGFDFRTLDLKEDNDEFAEKVVLMCALDPGETKRLMETEGEDGVGVEEVYRAFWEVVKRTFPGAGAVKNSDGLPSSRPTGSSGDAEPAESQD